MRACILRAQLPFFTVLFWEGRGTKVCFKWMRVIDLDGEMSTTYIYIYDVTLCKPLCPRGFVPSCKSDLSSSSSCSLIRQLLVDDITNKSAKIYLNACALWWWLKYINTELVYWEQGLHSSPFRVELGINAHVWRLEVIVGCWSWKRAGIVDPHSIPEIRWFNGLGDLAWGKLITMGAHHLISSSLFTNQH